MNKEILFFSGISFISPFVEKRTNKDITLLLGQNLIKWLYVIKPNIQGENES